MINKIIIIFHKLCKIKFRFDFPLPEKILLFDESHSLILKEIKHLKGHKFGVECLKFAPKNNFLISLGETNDKGLFVWDW